jgi:hypothetical protein
VDNHAGALASTKPRGGARAWRRVDVDDDESLAAVSCRSKALCVAAGGSGEAIASTHPTGGRRRWHRQQVDSRGLTGVSCASSSACLAVDYVGNALIGRRR